MGRVAVDAVDRTFQQAMPEGLGEGSLRFFMTADAKLIGFLCQQVQRLFRLMDAVTVRAGQLVLSVQTRRAARVGFRLGMAAQTVLTHFFGGDFRKGKDFGSISRVDVRLPGTVAGLAALVFPSFLFTGFKDLMRVPAELLGEILVTGTTRSRTDKFVFLRRACRFLQAARGPRERGAG